MGRQQLLSTEQGNGTDEPAQSDCRRPAYASRPRATGLDGKRRTDMSNRGTVTTTVSGLWFGGWLFTIGYAHPHFWQIVLALLIWPYYVGEAVAH
jgi:hypothetical protein